MLSSSPEGALLAVRVVPGARKSGLAGVTGTRLRVRLQAPPVEGKANRELERFLAGILGLKKNQVRLVAGERSREKTLLLRNLSVDEASARLQVLTSDQDLTG